MNFTINEIRKSGSHVIIYLNIKKSEEELN